MAVKNWTDEEIKTLKKLRKTKMTLKEIAEFMGRSRNSVGGKIVKLSNAGLMKVKVPQWTRENDANVKKWVESGYPTAYIANKLNRSIQSVVVRKKLLGLGSKGDNYTPRKDRIRVVLSCPEKFWSDKMQGKSFAGFTDIERDQMRRIAGYHDRP